MRALDLAFSAIAVFVLLCGCTQYAPVTDTLYYMGLKYGPSASVVLEERLYYTGATYEGVGLYADARGEPEKVPFRLAIKDGGGYRPFTLVADNPPVYGYSPYTRYSPGEPVTIGLMNERGGRIELRSSAPFEVRKKEGGQWKTIYSPVAAQVITPLENGTFKEWTWEQQGDSTDKVGPGDYMAVVDGRYAVNFTIGEGVPVVRQETTNYDNDTIGAFGGAPEHGAFSKFYTKYSPRARDDVEGLMLFKAWMKGADADKLRRALNATSAHSGGLEMLPCLAVHARYNGSPAWLIVYNWGMGGESLSHIRYYAVDDATGEIAYFTTCK